MHFQFWSGFTGVASALEPVLIQCGVYLALLIRFPAKKETDPTRIVKKSLELDTPIIVVSLNYRLNIFGFLCSSAIVSSSNFGGNFGLQDQHQALRWISRNIKYFGGDSKKITIGGQSAGAASVHSHVLNAKNVKKGGKRLFERAVLMSGSIGCLGPWRIDEAEERWEKVCRELGFGDSAEEKLKAVRGVSTEKLLEVSERMGWMLWNSVFDGVSILPSKDEGAPHVMFGIEDNGHEEAEQQPIEVMIGETNNEVPGS
jgi:carboxylesterase type B